MIRKIFYIVVASGLLLIVLGQLLHLDMFWLIVLWLMYTLIGLYDIFWSHHNVLKNYPVIGHLRYMLEFISPEIHQYFIEGPHNGRPFNREQREIVYTRAAGTAGVIPFGTQYDLLETGADFTHHSLKPCEVDETALRVRVGGASCEKPYSASRLNISAMSFGALSANAIRALNRGARLGGFFHNTGEGGLSPYHLQEGGDICWQIGTGYFGCRSRDGKFDAGSFQKHAIHERVRMIEIKLSQGAKPSHGGVLPAAKVSREIARIRMIAQDQDCISPPAHSAFSTPVQLLEFVAQLRELSGGKPVGFKLCIGKREEFLSIVKAILKTGIKPDFITIDGAEGGTGAAPYEFSDSMGLPLIEGLNFVHNALVGSKLREEIRLIASGKIITGFDILHKIALGADMINMARPMMFALGCIQARRCHTNTCPSGVATQDTRRGRAVNVPHRAEYVRNFHDATMRSCCELLGAMGYARPEQLGPEVMFRRLDDTRVATYGSLLPQLSEGELLSPPKRNALWQSQWGQYWKLARAEQF
ncbi:MAG: FMN-binding glutamate synthase family protein [Gammaproteobacteria bacterium]|jgi:glutamate synthase domain-containing protein 2